MVRSLGDPNSWPIILSLQSDRRQLSRCVAGRNISTYCARCHYRNFFFLKTTLGFHLRMFACWGYAVKVCISNISMNELSLHAVGATHKESQAVLLNRQNI
jgi:hypothetical protein